MTVSKYNRKETKITRMKLEKKPVVYGVGIL